MHLHRKRAVEVRRLRQVGHALRRVAFDAAFDPADGPAQRAQQAALAGAIGADHGRQRRRLETAAEVVHRGVAPVADRQAVQHQ